MEQSEVWRTGVREKTPQLISPTVAVKYFCILAVWADFAELYVFFCIDFQMFYS